MIPFVQPSPFAHITVCTLMVKHAGLGIALSWLPMQLKILHWRPEFHSWSPTFSHLATEKKRLVASWRLPKKVNFQP